MPETKAQMFLRAKQVIRLHPDWSDEKVAEQAQLPRGTEAEIIRTARADLAADSGS